ncbi:DNA helicase UvrD [Candidatus Daviesbacteria bacterium]|nr:DNA helicase UvrD [Candidatus Daviesbacteria bacterium]
MAYVADLHIHSRFSRACSSALNIPNLSLWAKYKGIDLMGTGDCLHPLWQTELKSVLKKEQDGFFEFEGVKFVLTTEVACIYSEGGKVRRIHTLIMLPSFESAINLSSVLTKKGMNLSSDGRPILGLSTKALCEIVFQIEPGALIIPAHIFTPWFSLFGSESGYDLLEDCFGEFSDQIYAIETGLSSEPAMNWRIKDLDKKSIVSFSDAHSLPRLGREVTIMGGNLTFDSLRYDLKNQNIVGTIEFFPEEGKYHYSGHRSCGIVYSPKELKEKGEICPKCKRRLTVGVMTRVEDLADRSSDEIGVMSDKEGIIKSKEFPKRSGFRMLVQLEEILAEAFNTSVSTQKVKNEYVRLVKTFDNELMILTKRKIEEIAKVAGEKVAEGVKRVREGKLKIKPGFDNTYGVVKIWDKEEKSVEEAQISMF